MRVPLLDLQAQYATIKDEILGAVADVLESQRCIHGPRIAEFEEKIAAASGCEFAVGASSGTDAILNSLMSLDIGPGDEVITTPFSFFATAGCIARVGARPVFVDIDAQSYNINPALVEGAVTKKSRAVMPVHLFGQMAEMDSIMAVADTYGLAVIEDAAQSITSEYKGRKAGAIGTAGCFSFFPSKNLGGIGDGGMIVTNDAKLYERIKVMRNHGQTGVYRYKYVGGNFRLDAIQAAALLVKLKYLDEWSAGRRKNAAYYDKKFKGTAVQTPYVGDEFVSIYNQYVVRVQRRDEVLAHLKSKDIGCAVYYPLPLHLQECFEYLGHKAGDFPEAEKAAGEVLALPVYPELTDEMQDYVVETMLNFLS
jgi:dTDP-4-amino-4,6-dideoxygalactose transaminase